MQCPTVKIKADNEQGFSILNESDFDEAIHELYTEAAEEKNGNAGKGKGKGKKDDPAKDSDASDSDNGDGSAPWK